MIRSHRFLVYSQRCSSLLDLIIEQAGKLRAWMAFVLLLVIVGNVLMRYVFDIESVALPLLTVDGDAYRRKPAEFIPNAAIWLGGVLSAQRSVAQPAVSAASRSLQFRRPIHTNGSSPLLFFN